MLLYVTGQSAQSLKFPDSWVADVEQELHKVEMEERKIAADVRRDANEVKEKIERDADKLEEDAEKLKNRTRRALEENESFIGQTFYTEQRF